METYLDIPVLTFPDAAAWRQWLEDNYELQTGIWIKIAKKNSGIASVSRAEALNEALCYGWIDGQARSIDQIYYLQKYTPRRPRSLWSKVNIGHVERLIAAGAMRPPGLAAIEAAKADGRWDAAYDSQKEAIIPDDLQQMLDSHPAAKARFELMGRAERYSYLFQLMTAKTAAIRERRLGKIIQTLNQSV